MSRGPRKSKEVREAEARDHELYAMKRSEAEPRHLIFCSICGDLKSWAQFVPGNPPICCDCDNLKRGRATPAEPGTTAVGQTAQLALFEISGVTPDLLGQGKDLGGSERHTREILALFKS